MVVKRLVASRAVRHSGCFCRRCKPQFGRCLRWYRVQASLLARYSELDRYCDEGFTAGFVGFQATCSMPRGDRESLLLAPCSPHQSAPELFLIFASTGKQLT